MEKISIPIQSPDILLAQKAKSANGREDARALMLVASSLFFAYLLPFRFLPYSPFYNDWLAIFGVIIAAAYTATKKPTTIHIPWISALPLALAGIIVLQVLFGMLTINSDAILPISYLVVAAIAIVLGATFAAPEGGASKLCLALAAAHLSAGLASLLIASLQFIEAEAILDPFAMIMPREPGSSNRPAANVAQPNQLALLFCIAIASVWWLYQSKRVRGSLALLTVFALLWGLVMTQSRIGWIIVPAFAFFAGVSRDKANFKKISIKVLAGLVIAYAGLVIFLPEIASYFGSVTTGVQERISGESPRLIMLQQALHISLTYPWFGAGWYEFGPEQIKIAHEFAPVGYSQHAHNIVMNFAAELGWPITILVFAILIYWFFKSCFRRSVSKEIGFATLVFVAVMVHSMVEFPIWYAYVLIPLAFLIGMVHQEQFASKEITVSQAFVALIFFILLGGALGAAMDYRRVSMSMWASGWNAVNGEIEGFSNTKPTVTIFPHYYDLFQARLTVVREKMPQEEIALMENVAKRFGYLNVLEKTALVYTLNNREEEALKTLNTLRKLHHDQYSGVYKTWGKYAKREPERFSVVFNQMAVPNEANK